LHHMLHNEVYCGRQVLNTTKGETLTGEVTAIVTDDLRERALARLVQDQKHNNRPTKDF
jgi:hypothetical protein